MKTRLLPVLAAFLAAPLLNAQTTLTSGHTDIGIAYEGDAWDFHVHDEETDTEYAPDEAVLQVGAAAETTVPANPAFSFLGDEGDPVWILPATENPELLFLGIGTEEIADGTFLNDELTLTLTGFSGPGGFILYITDEFGTPTVLMNTTDGLSSADAITIPTGSHGHYQWAFQAVGSYQLTFTASALLPDSSPVSGEGTYDVGVVPEPGTWALLGLSGIVLLLARSRRTIAKGN
ncbi:MAG TPA: choice-of-anchor M domain-containing protein [Terrimicrobiaceae bacterium]|nr:choice-of-anchor M domain-containing protein [Terrimicrobiaceae bacterium]